MSSVNRPAFWRRIGPRWGIGLGLLLWLCSALLLVTMLQQATLSMTQGASEQIDEELEELREIVESAHHVFVEPPQGGPYDDLVALRTPPEASYLEFLSLYVAAIRQQREQAAAEARQLLDVRLWLLGETLAFPELELSPEVLLHLMERETPERFHEPLYATLEPRLERWPASEQWSALPAAERLRLALTNEWELQEHERCVLTDAEPAGAERLEIDSEPFFALRLQADTPDGGTICWVRAVIFADGAELYYGLPFSDTYERLESLHDTAWLALLLGLLPVLAAGLWLDRKLLKRLESLHLTLRAVADGDAAVRVPLNSGGDEFARLGADLNAMLDGIGKRMAEVRALPDNLAHDLRTSLTRLRNRIEFFSQIEQPTAGDADRLIEEADLLIDTFSALLRISELEQGAPRCDFVEFDLVGVLEDCAELYEPVLSELGMALNVETPSRAVTVIGDRGLWIQALSNLLENALRYAPGSKTLGLSLRYSDAAPRIEVRDQGAGVPEAELERVLERFYRLDKVRNSPGTGLGLALVAAVCRAHEVSIRLYNDRGLVVRMDWPKKKAKADRKSTK